MNQASLLRDLVIERELPSASRPPPQAPHRWRLWAGASVAGASAALALIAALLAQSRPPLVETAPVTRVVEGRGAGGSLLDASGYVVARRQATVSSKVTGRVTEVLIEEGQSVREGEIIARLDDSNLRAGLAQAEAEVVAAAARVRLAQVGVQQAAPRLERARQLHDRGFLSNQAVEDADVAVRSAMSSLELARSQADAVRVSTRAAQLSVDDTVVRAPFSGVITVKAAQPGEIVSPISAGGGFTRTGIGTIVDMDSLEVQVDVAESFINRVREGMPTQVTLNAYPEWRIPGRVLAVIPSADRSKATVGVRIELLAKDRRIVPEMGAKVAFLDRPVEAEPPRPPQLLVPSAAIAAQEGDRADVYVIAGGRAIRRQVTLGAALPQGRVALGGLRPGDQLAVGKLEKLSDNMAVRVKSPSAANSE